jgi:BirA family transcriptional regulator, biotin operon repressor / biotin---[acetyl-CoA-carboxylase] ligase
VAFVIFVVNLKSAVDRISAEKMRNELRGVIIGREIIVFEETTSTNDVILQRTTSETKEGLVVFAEHQTAGRGQHGKHWESAPGKGLWFSVLLRPKIDMAESARLTNWAAQTIAVTIEQELSLRATIKSPNDVYVDGRKVAGVLVEMRAQKNAPHIGILGIGVNVNHAAEDFPAGLRATAGSLAVAAGRPLDRHLLAVALLRNLDRTYPAIVG